MTSAEVRTPPGTPSNKPTLPRSRRCASIRVLDLVIVLLSAVIWVPLVLIISAVILATSGRPVFFRQARIGRDEMPFTMIKFRSMRNGDNPLIPDPNRITGVGRFLRQTSMDELPQLVNVIMGEMSLVGPRPMLAQQHSKMSPADRRRTNMRPGLTGTAQVNGRNSLSWDQRFVHDLAWVDDPSVRSYVSTLRRTAGVMVSGAGVDGHDPQDPFVTDTPTTIRLIDFDLSGPAAGPVTDDRLEDRAA